MKPEIEQKLVECLTALESLLRWGSVIYGIIVVTTFVLALAVIGWVFTRMIRRKK